jgi:hypothetical protein
MIFETILWIFLGCYLLALILTTRSCVKRGNPPTFWCQVMKGLRGDFRP